MANKGHPVICYNNFMRRIIFFYILLACALIGGILDADDFIIFFTKDPLVFKTPDTSGLKSLSEIDVETNRDDYTLAIECRARNLPPTASVLTFRRFWLTNYYMCPSKFYYLSEERLKGQDVKKYIAEKHIDYIVKSGEAGVALIQTETVLPK